jgi:hypothetical protein
MSQRWRFVGSLLVVLAGAALASSCSRTTSSPDVPTTPGVAPATSGRGYAESFVARISAAPAPIDLAALIETFGLPHGTLISLVAKARAAQASLDKGNTSAACNQLQALINEAQAQSGRRLTADQATAIVAAARDLRAALGCP